MAYACREIGAPLHEVFELLADPWTYPEWLAGASRMRDVDDGWPAVGAKFHHRVGLGPLTIADSTELLAFEPDRLIRLAVRARPLVSAVVTFTVVGDHERCVVTFEEEPRLRIVGNLVRPVFDPMTHVRNHLSLRRLEDVLRARSTRALPGQPTSSAISP